MAGPMWLAGAGGGLNCFLPMSDREEIKERVKSAVNLAEWIVRDGVDLAGGPTEFKACCPFHLDGSPSFTVFLKNGAWAFYCFGCEAQGDVFEWVMRRKGINFPEALQVVANAVSIALPAAEGRLYQPPQVRAARDAGNERRPFDPEKFRALVDGGKVHEYLTITRRLEARLLADYSVGETVDGEAYSFAYKWRPPGWPVKRERPAFEFCKVVKVDRPEGKKVEWREPAGGRNILFGMESGLVKAAHASGGELVICEGEIDAISWAQYGFAGVSVPCGAKSLGWIDVCWDWLAAFKKIHIAFDEDPAGRMKVVEIVTRLGMQRTDMLRMPCREAEETDSERLEGAL